MIGIDHAAAIQPDEGIRQEVVGSDKRVLDRGVGQLAVVQGDATGIHLCGAVPFLVDVAVVLHAAVKAVDQYQRQLVLVLGQSGGDDKVAVAGGSADIHHALVVESRAQHAHVDTAAKGGIVVLQLLQHGAGASLVQGIQVGDDRGDAAIQVGAVGAQGLQILLHVGIHLTAVQAQRGISVHQQVHVEDEVLVTSPQVTHLAKEAHALLHLDGVDGAECWSRHHNRGG